VAAEIHGTLRNTRKPPPKIVLLPKCKTLNFY